MSSLLRIRIRVMIEEAEKLAALLKSLNGISKGSKGASGSTAGLKGALGAVGKEGAAALKVAAKAMDDLGDTSKRTANQTVVDWIQAYQKRTAALTKEMAKQAQMEAKAAAAQKKRLDAARARDISKDYAGQYTNYAKMLSDEQKSTVAAAAAKERAAVETAQRIAKINQGFRADDAKRAAQRVAAEQRVAASIVKINQGLRADDAKRGAAQLRDAERFAAHIRSVNANLRKLDAKAQAERERAEIVAARRAAQMKVQIERDALEQMARLWKSYQAGQMSARHMLTGMEAYKGMSPQGSKVNLAAAGYVKKHKDATENLAAAQLRQAKTSDVARVATTRLNTAHERHRKSILAVGTNVQWIGRQLEYNFTLPILYAGKAVFDLAMETDKSVTKLVKVWGTAGDAAEDLNTQMVKLGINNGKLAASATTVDKEGFKLGQSMRVLSAIYGVQIDKVAELESRWAAAGLTGYDLARATELTLQSMVVGDIEDVSEAFGILNQIMGGYGITVKDLLPVLAAVNTAENITASQFSEITKVIARAASSAKQYGVSLEELVGIATVLTPAFGSAETAGNGLRSLLTRIMAPTDKARAMMNELGLAVDEGAWQSTNATGRIKLLGEAMRGLTQDQKAQVNAAVFGIYQNNRASGVLEDYASQASQAIRVEEALKEAREGNSETIAQYNKEIDQYLRSESVSMERAKVMIQQAASDILSQLLPSILILAGGLASLAEKFANLDESTRTFIVLGIVAVALLGPFMRLGGAFVQLIGVFGHVVKAIGWIIGAHGGQAVAAHTAAAAELEAAAASNTATAAAGRKGLAALLTNPWFLLAAAIVAALVAIWYFRDELAPVFKFIHDTAVRAFNALPASVQNALIAVVTVVKNAALAVYKWLSYINPFAKHSPSLVEQVTAGVDLIARKYASLSNIGGIFRKAANDLAAFKAAAAGALAAGENAERAKTRESVAETNPEALPALDNLYGSLDSLRSGLDLIKAEMNDQQAVVNALQQRYDDLGRAVDSANDELDRQRDIASELKEQLDAAKEEADKWASAPIQGMKAYTDAIFENELEQKKLRLAMMDIEDAVGPLDSLRERMAALQGEVEQMRAMQTELREAGAGSEVTGSIEDQIRALESQQQAFEDQVRPLEDLQDQLDALQRAGERLDLEEAIKFDPLRKQIDDAANAVEEFPFDVIMAGLTDAQKRVMELTDAYDIQQGKVKDQEAVVKGLEDARKILGDQLDAEKLKLADLQAAYDAYEDQIRAIESAINDLTSAIGSANDAADAAGDSLLGSGAGDFAEGDVPALPVGMEGGDFDAWLKAKQDELDKLLGGLNPFEKVKQKWEEFKGWWRENVDFTNLMSEIRRGIDAVPWGEAWDGIKNGISGFINWADETWTKFSNGRLWKQLVRTWDQLKTTAGDVWNSLKRHVADAVDILGPKIKQFSDLAAPLGEVLGDFGGAAKATFIALVGVIGGFIFQLLLAWEYILKFVSFLLPVWDLFWRQLMNIVGFVIDLIYNTIKFTLAILTGDWEMAWEAIKGVFIAVWDLMMSSFQVTLDFLRWGGDQIKAFFGAAWDWVWQKTKEVWDLVIGYVAGLVDRIITAAGDIGRLLWDYFSGGFNWMRDEAGKVVDGIVDFFTKLPERIRSLAEGVKEAAKDIGRAIINGIVDIFSAGLNLGANLGQSIYGGIAGAINSVLTAVENKINELKIDPPIGPTIKFPNVSFPRMPASLHEGGIVPGLRGMEVPAILQAGERVLSLAEMDAMDRMWRGQASEALPMSAGDGDRTVNIYGDLSFPNITDGDDAEDLIANLEALAVR